MGERSGTEEEGEGGRLAWEGPLGPLHSRIWHHPDPRQLP